MWPSCGKVNSSAGAWHYPLQAQNASSASSSTPFRSLPKFAFVQDCGEWWISGYCFTFLSESLGLSPSTRESRGSWQGFFGSSRMWIREKAPQFFFLEERKIVSCSGSREQDGLSCYQISLLLHQARETLGGSAIFIFFLPSHHKLSVFLALVISCAHFVVGEGVERVPSQVEGIVWVIIWLEPSEGLMCFWSHPMLVSLQLSQQPVLEFPHPYVHKTYFYNIWFFFCSMRPLLFVLSAAHVVERCSPSFWKHINGIYLFISPSSH